MPLVSIIMPSLNVEKYIEKCLTSAISQSLKDIEIICIDAGSTDGTKELIERYATEDSRIKCINSKVKSYGYQVNLGIESAKGDYIAILETDDYIDSNMYNKLYDIALKDNLDYARADFDIIYEYGTVDNNRHIVMRNCIFDGGGDEHGGYYKVFNAKSCPQIFLLDWNVWSGIYKRSFINKYNIRFNESAGAAYQDIGFKMLVLTRADRIECIDYSGYRYRMDRDGCSSCSNNVLKYAYQEFKRLIEDIHLDETETFKWVLLRMADVLICEYRKLMTKTYNTCDEAFYMEFIEPYYNWFNSKLTYYISTGLICEMDMDKTKYDDLMKLLKDEPSYREEWHSQNHAKKDYWKQITTRIADNPVVIVSYGIWGKKMLQNLIRLDYKVEAVCDNNPKLWNELVGGIVCIKPIDETVKSNRSAVYIIANKKYGEELRMQLLDCGVKDENIITLSKFFL